MNNTIYQINITSPNSRKIVLVSNIQGTFSRIDYKIYFVRLQNKYKFKKTEIIPSINIFSDKSGMKLEFKSEKESRKSTKRRLNDIVDIQCSISYRCTIV